MFPRIAVVGVAALVLVPGAALTPTRAQSPAQPTPPAANCVPAVTNVDDADDLSRQIRDKLAAEGFKDVQVKPTAFLVSAKDKNDKPIVLLIGPDSMTVLQAEGSNGGGNGADAQTLGDKDKLIRQ